MVKGKRLINVNLEGRVRGKEDAMKMGGSGKRNGERKEADQCKPGMGEGGSRVKKTL